MSRKLILRWVGIFKILFAQEVQFTVAATNETDFQLEKTLVSFPGFLRQKGSVPPGSCAHSGRVSLPTGSLGHECFFAFSEFFFPPLQVGNSKSVWAEPLGALPPLQTERRWNVDSRQSCDILHSIVILMWSMHIFTVSLTHWVFLSTPLTFFFCHKTELFHTSLKRVKWHFSFLSL